MAKFNTNKDNEKLPFEPNTPPAEADGLMDKYYGEDRKLSSWAKPTPPEDEDEIKSSEKS